LILLQAEKFYGIFDQTVPEFVLACIDVDCPEKITANDQLKNQYQVSIGEHAQQVEIICLSNVQLPTKKL
jgi:hypothetical protein